MKYDEYSLNIELMSHLSIFCEMFPIIDATNHPFFYYLVEVALDKTVEGKFSRFADLQTWNF